MQDEGLSKTSLERYAGIVWRRRYTALAMALAVLSICTWGSFLWPKTYETSATVTIEKSGLMNPLIPGGNVLATEERIRNVKNMITSRAIIEKVIKRLHPEAAAKNGAQYERLIKSFQNRLKVTVQGAGQRSPDLFTITYSGRDPREVLNTVDTIVKVFIAESVGNQRMDVFGAYDFIDDQLTEYKTKLEDSDKDIRAFREKNPSMIPQNEATIVGRIETFRTARVESEIKLKELQKKRENLQKQLSGEKELSIAFVSSDGSPSGRLTHLNNRLMVLMTKFTDDYPEVIKVRSEIDELQKEISQLTRAERANPGNADGSEMKALNPVYRQLKEELSKTATEIEILKVRLDELARQQHEERTILARMPKEQEEWSKLQRDRSAYQRVYDELIQKRESARVSKNLEISDKTTTFRVVDPPVMPKFPVSPNRIKLILIGLVLGTAVGAGVAVGLDRFDRSFKDEEALEKELQLPVLASVPSVITEADILAEARLDKKVFTAATAYLVLIGLVLVGEIIYRNIGFSAMD
jgi:polysaccharide chain length determinant protein (PEP-CTERM system associated)